MYTIQSLPNSLLYGQDSTETVHRPHVESPFQHCPDRTIVTLVGIVSYNRSFGHLVFKTICLQKLEERHTGGCNPLVVIRPCVQLTNTGCTPEYKMTLTFICPPSGGQGDDLQIQTKRCTLVRSTTLYTFITLYLYNPVPIEIQQLPSDSGVAHCHC